MAREKWGLLAVPNTATSRAEAELRTCRAHPHNSFYFSLSVFVLCCFYLIPDFVFVFANKPRM